MVHEIEVKLEASGSAARKLASARWLKRLEAAPRKREHLVSVYYDTAGCALRERGMSLRVRHIGKRRIQTVKAGNRMAGDFVHDQRRTKKKAAKAFAMGFISGDDHAHARALLAQASDAGEDLDGAKPFWR